MLHAALLQMQVSLPLLPFLCESLLRTLSNLRQQNATVTAQVATATCSGIGDTGTLYMQLSCDTCT